MGKRSLQRKLRKYKLSKWGVIGVILVVFSLIAYLAELVAGNELANLVESKFHIHQRLAEVVGWIIEHPDKAAIIMACMGFSLFVYSVWQETKPVKEFPVNQGKLQGWYDCFYIWNKSGDDLIDCTIKIARADDKAVDFPCDWYMGNREAEIRNGNKVTFGSGELEQAITIGFDEDRGRLFDDKPHELELFFRGNTISGSTKSMTIWVVVKATYHTREDDGEIVSFPAIERIETSRPDFG